MDIVDGECKIHGKTTFYSYIETVSKAKRTRCRQCSMDAVSKRRKNIKIMALEYKGGKCEICSYNKCVTSLDFHHLDPSKKDFAISKNGHTRSWEKTKIELDKCILVCKNCHGEIHEKEFQENKID
jgi:hypothetical protein